MMKLCGLWLFVMLTLCACQLSHRLKKDQWPKPLNEENILLRDEKNDLHSLGELMKEHDGLVVWFWQIKCPCVQRYQGRFNDLKARYPSIKFVLVDAHAWDARGDIEKERMRRNIVEPIYKDDHGTLRDALFIKGTPSTALINQQQQVLYVGWPDNERPLNEEHRIPYLDNALKEFVTKEPIESPSSTMFGCPLP